LFTPIITSKSLLKQDIPVMLMSSLALFFVLQDGLLTRLEGGLFFAGLVAYLIWTLLKAKEGYSETTNDSTNQSALWLVLGGIGAGLGLLIRGANVLILGAVNVATAWGVPERVIGLSLVAVGTSLPELASSIVAAIKRQSDIVLGNIIGSNIFNILGILGITSLVKPLNLSAGVNTDLWVMIGFAFLLVPLMLTGLKLVRWEGLVMMVAYGCYIALLF
jgi:cation:H+ antiporter